MARNLIARMFRRTSAEGGGEHLPLPSAPDEGQVYAFRTEPYSEFAPPETGRYAAFKILGATDTQVAVAVLDGIWPEAPALNAMRASSIVNEHRFAHTGKPAIFGVNRDWWEPEKDLNELSYIGRLAVSRAERSFAKGIFEFAPGSRFSTIHAVNYAAEGEWRWSNDQAAFVHEHELNKAKQEAERAAKEERYRTRLSKLTWDQLLAETPFDNWSPSPPFPPEEFANAARKVIREACLAIQKLGPKPRKAEVRKVLKQTVQWFNDADERAGGVIETEEREDICAVLEEMAFVARQKALAEEIDAWRDW